MKRVLLLGYGNPLRGDDGIGWRVTEAYDRSRRDVRPDLCVETRVSRQLLPEHAELITNYDLVLFIDAAAEAEAGVVRRRECAPQQSRHGRLTHNFTPDGLLALARDAYGRFPRAVLFTISANAFPHSEELSPPVLAAIPHVLELITTELGAAVE